MVIHLDISCWFYPWYSFSCRRIMWWVIFQLSVYHVILYGDMSIRHCLQFSIISYSFIHVTCFLYSIHVSSIQYLYDSVVAWFQCLYARAPFLLHTHSLGRFLTTLDLHVQILDALLYCSGVHWARTLCEEYGVSLPDTGILIPLAFLYFCDYSLILVYQS